MRPIASPTATPMIVMTRTWTRKIQSTVRLVAPTRLHGGDDVAPPIDERRDGARDADAADEKRCQPEEGQELAQPVERARDLRRRVAPICNHEARRFEFPLGQARETRRHPRARRRRVVGRFSAYAPAHERARLHEPCLFEICGGDEHRGPYVEAVGHESGSLVAAPPRTVKSTLPMRILSPMARPS